MAETYERTGDGEMKNCGCGEQDASSTRPCCNGHEDKDCGSKAASTESCGGEQCMPAPTFSTFILSLASSAMVNLGEVPDPSTGKLESNLVLAKHTIDIINMLQEKIRDGLDDDERRLLEGVLYELRMKFVLKR